MENDINILNKLLNHKIFLSQMPGIREVIVREYGKDIDIIFLFKEGFRYEDYRPTKSEARALVNELAKMAGINTQNIHIYPQ